MRRFVQFLIPALIALVSIGLLAVARGNSAVRSQIDDLARRVRAELIETEATLGAKVMP